MIKSPIHLLIRKKMRYEADVLILVQLVTLGSARKDLGNDLKMSFARRGQVLPDLLSFSCCFSCRKRNSKSDTIHHGNLKLKTIQCKRQSIHFYNARIENLSFQVNLKGRVICYRADGRFRGFQLEYLGVAWDVESGTSVKARHYKSRQGAIEHAVKQLIDELKAKGILS